jgi:hypothetical protein
LLIQVIRRGVFDVDTLDTLAPTALAGGFAIALDLATFAFITGRYAVAVSPRLDPGEGGLTEKTLPGLGDVLAAFLARTSIGHIDGVVVMQGVHLCLGEEWRGYLWRKEERPEAGWRVWGTSGPLVSRIVYEGTIESTSYYYYTSCYYESMHREWVGIFDMLNYAR